MRCVAAMLLLLVAPIARAQWPQFRGPRGDGHSTATGLPLTWNEGENVAWKVAVPGRGYSSPVISEGKIWLTTALEAEGSLRAVAFDLGSGKIVHDRELFRPETWQHRHAENSHASPTPVVEPGRVYAHFGDYGTACLSTGSGEVIWRSRELRLQHEHGPGSSPILWRHLLIVNFDGIGDRFVAALDKATGELAWKAPRSVPLERKPSHGKAFATPLVIMSAGEPQLISPGAGQVSSYDPATGEEIWRVRYEGYSNVPRPVAGLGLVFVDTGYIKPHLLAIHPWRPRRRHRHPRALALPLAGARQLVAAARSATASTWSETTGASPAGSTPARAKTSGASASAAATSPRRSTPRGGSTPSAAKAAPSSSRPATPTASSAAPSSAAPSSRRRRSPDSAFFVRTESHLYRLEDR